MTALQSSGGRHKGAILFQFLVGESWPPRTLVTMNAKPICITSPETVSI
jgi:hypothetical protein